MNVAGVMLLRFIGSLEHSAAAQAAYAVGYTELFSFITWTSVGLMGAAATIAGQNLGAGRPDRVVEGVWVASRIGLVRRGRRSACCSSSSRGLLLAMFGMDDPIVVGIGEQLLRYLAVSGLFVTVALCFTGALQGTGDTRSPLYISIVSQIVVPLGICAILQATRRPAAAGHLDGDRARPHDALRAQHHALPPPEVARDSRRAVGVRSASGRAHHRSFRNSPHVSSSGATRACARIS